jgi:hypothetical protein
MYAILSSGAKPVKCPLLTSGSSYGPYEAPTNSWALETLQKKKRVMRRYRFFME